MCGDHAAAAADFSACVALDPSNAVAHYNRAACYDALGRYELAVDDYKQALEAER
jgi:Tfp pilus assembly protein PilF